MGKRKRARKWLNTVKRISADIDRKSSKLVEDYLAQYDVNLNTKEKLDELIREEDYLEGKLMANSRAQTKLIGERFTETYNLRVGDTVRFRAWNKGLVQGVIVKLPGYRDNKIKVLMTNKRACLIYEEDWSDLKKI